MSSHGEPGWLDRHAVAAWAEGAAAAVGGTVRLLALDSSELLAAGTGGGEPHRSPLMVNRETAAWVEVRPADPQGLVALQPALILLQSLAEARNSVADLVRTTADRWRELTVLYRSAELLHGGLRRQEIVAALLDHAMRALRVGRAAARCVEAGQAVFTTRGEGAADLERVVEWGTDLTAGILVCEVGELERQGLRGQAPEVPFLVVPLRCRERSYGAMAVAPLHGRGLSAADLKLAALLAGQAGQALANSELVDQMRASERFQRELEVAADIQRSSLPPADVDLGWLEVAAACSTAEVVGGDSYLFSCHGDSVVAGVVDVCGHGLSSAVLTNVVTSQLQALSLTRSSPSELLALANDLLVERLGTTGLFVTAALTRLEPTGKLEVVSAGHPPPVVVLCNGETREIDYGSIPLGIVAGTGFPAGETTLPPGGTVVLYSDGLTEAASPDGERYGVARFLELMHREVPRHSSCRGIVDVALLDLDTFQGGPARQDDLTIVVMRRRE